MVLVGPYTLVRGAGGGGGAISGSNGGLFLNTEAEVS